MQVRDDSCPWLHSDELLRLYAGGGYSRLVGAVQQRHRDAVGRNEIGVCKIDTWRPQSHHAAVVAVNLCRSVVSVEIREQRERERERERERKSGRE